MAVEIKFSGDFTFDNLEALQEAIGEIKEFLAEENASIQKEWNTAHSIAENKISINLNTGCAENDFLSYEGIIEILADFASTGKVIGWRDDYDEGEKEVYDAELIDYSGEEEG